MITTSCWNNRDRFAISAGIFALEEQGIMVYQKIGLLFSFLRGVFFKIGIIIRGKSNFLHMCNI